MASKDIIGHIDCPVCGHEAPVKEDKNGHAYVHCAHRCNAQVFTRNDHRDGLLRKRMRAVTVSDIDTVTAPAAAPAPIPAPAVIPVSVPKPAPAVTVPPKPEQKPKANWFSPVIGGAKHGRA
jgi:hypothetical protein